MVGFDKQLCALCAVLGRLSDRAMQRCCQRSPPILSVLPIAGHEGIPRAANVALGTLAGVGLW